MGKRKYKRRRLHEEIQKQEEETRADAENFARAEAELDKIHINFGDVPKLMAKFNQYKDFLIEHELMDENGNPIRARSVSPRRNEPMIPPAEEAKIRDI